MDAENLHCPDCNLPSVVEQTNTCSECGRQF